MGRLQLGLSYTLTCRRSKRRDGKARPRLSAILSNMESETPYLLGHEDRVLVLVEVRQLHQDLTQIHVQLQI